MSKEKGAVSPQKNAPVLSKQRGEINKTLFPD